MARIPIPTSTKVPPEKAFKYLRLFSLKALQRQYPSPNSFTSSAFSIFIYLCLPSFYLLSLLSSLSSIFYFIYLSPPIHYLSLYYLFCILFLLSSLSSIFSLFYLLLSSLSSVFYFLYVVFRLYFVSSVFYFIYLLPSLYYLCLYYLFCIRFLLSRILSLFHYQLPFSSSSLH